MSENDGAYRTDRYDESASDGYARDEYGQDRYAQRGYARERSGQHENWQQEQEQQGYGQDEGSQIPDQRPVDGPGGDPRIHQASPRAVGPRNGQTDHPRSRRGEVQEFAPEQSAVDGGGSRSPRERYPVVEERPLGRPERRWFRGDRRELGQLPELRPGCVYVFGINGSYEQSSATTHLRGTEQELVDATSVSVVDVRPRQVTTHVTVPSASAATDFIVRVNFGCEVETATEIARQNLTDLRSELQAHLKQDPNILEFQHRFYPDEIEEVRRQILAYMLAAYRQRPPRIVGMRIWLQDVDVQTPRDLRRHATRIRDKRWGIEEQVVDHQAERHRVAHHEDMLSNAERAEAFAVSRGDMTADRAAERQFDQEEKRADRLHEELTKLVDSGAINRMPVQQLDLAEAAIAQLLGRPPQPRRDGPPPTPIAHRKPLRDSSPEPDDAEDEHTPYVPSDEELDSDFGGQG